MKSPTNDEYEQYTADRESQLFDSRYSRLCRDTDRKFQILLLIQWLFGIFVAFTISPWTWIGSNHAVHLHVWVAILLGGTITLYPFLLAAIYPGRPITRHTIAVGQMLWSALLIHLMGGRIETHFHVFGSLAILALYRDWRVLVTATLVVALDHFLRGVYWPMSVFGVLVESPFRWIEHAGWVLFEISFLIYACRKSNREVLELCNAQANLEWNNRKQAKKSSKKLSHAKNQLDASRSQLSQKELHLNAVLDASLDPIVSTDRNGKITSASSSIEKVFGWKPDELVGRNINILMPESHQSSRDSYLDQYQETNESSLLGNSRELSAIRKDGTQFPCEVSANRVEGVGDTFFMGILRDITNRKEAEKSLRDKEEQLRHKQKLESIGALAGGVAHEFNNLLQGIKGYTQFAMDELDPSTQPYQDLEQTQAATDRAAELTSQLLGFSRQQPLVQKKVCPNQIVSGLSRIIRPTIGENIDLVLDLADSPGLVQADTGVLHQILLNLCINARDAMSGCGGLVIKTSNQHFNQSYCEIHPDTVPGNYVKISVTDTGCGMSPEVQDRIFDPFFTTKEVGKGTGLGLAMVYGVIQQHGGMIHVYSEENIGTTFKLYLPTTDQPDHTDDPSNTFDPSEINGMETILFVDDDPIVRKLGARILRDAGYEVMVAEDGLEALEIFREHRSSISLVLSDIVMPKCNGHEVYDRVKQIDPDMKIVFCTGYDPETIQRRHLYSEDVQLIEKPFDPELLLITLRNTLDLKVPSIN